MDQPEIALHRLSSQKLACTDLSTAPAVVSWMGAMQAQDYPMAKWAIGLRLPASTDQSIETALTNGDILRTHLLRPTWHFVTPADIGWLIDLTASQIKAGQRSRDHDLELTEETYAKSNRIIERALSGGDHLPRESLIALLNQAGIATDQNRASHLFMRAELEKLICSGVTRGNKTTYALLSERVQNPRSLARDEALLELARRYFASRSPATYQDFLWWSGLPAKDATQALESVKPDLYSETVDGATYWLSPEIHFEKVEAVNSVLLVPVYDELLISYANRTAVISSGLEQHLKEISDRGVFRPIIVINGRVGGIWKRIINKDSMIVDLQPFSELDPAVLRQVGSKAEHFARFFGKNVEIEYRSS